MHDSPPHAESGNTVVVPPAKSGAERRETQRYRCTGSAEVLLLERDMMFRGEIRNLSLGGCFVATRLHVHVEESNPVVLRFNLRNHQFKTLAQVANIRPGVGIGFIFRHPNENIAEDFKALVGDYDCATPLDAEF